jgi:preprotein translocase subunit SecG
LFTFLLVVHAIIAAALVTVILMQRSEGGGLTSSGSPSGLMSARGAADFLTRLTAILATIFVVMAIVLAFLATSRSSETVDVNAARKGATQIQTPPVTAPADENAPFAGAALNATQAANATAPADNGVPLAK